MQNVLEELAVQMRDPERIDIIIEEVANHILKVSKFPEEEKGK